MQKKFQEEYTALNHNDTCARLCCMLSAVILQLKQQHEINEAEWNEKAQNN